ncbi:uncharacterized protein [Nicotiana sylvestris]|uniref:uncharacterized protein n=1 Tax=Nicotiana sylvestris TaxID=4096 RepID=UPI00388C4D9C
MAAPPNFKKGQSTYRPPRFNGQYYGWWKTRMHEFIMVEDSELWDVICDGPFVPTKNLGDPAIAIPKTKKEFNDADRKISACQSAKEIWEALQTAHEGTTQMKQSKIDMLTTEYELFRMKDDEFIQDMHTLFTSIINDLDSLGESISRNKLVRKILSKKKKKKKKDNERRETKKEKNLVLKTDSNDSSGEDRDMTYLIKRFQKIVHKNGGIPKRGSSSKPRNYDLCHKCGKPGHFIKDCPLLNQDQYNNNFDKAAKRN